jgi:hypothetical protein
MPSTTPSKPPSRRESQPREEEVPIIRIETPIRIERRELEPFPGSQQSVPQQAGPAHGGGGDPPAHGAVKDERKSVAEMISELLREAAVLVAIFGWIDPWTKAERESCGRIIAALAFASVLFVLGVLVERLRDER